MTKQRPRIERGYFHHDGIVREATSAEKLLWEEIDRLTRKNASLLAELHYHFGCDPECVQRHAAEPSPRLETALVKDEGEDVCRLCGLTWIDGFHICGGGTL